MSGNTNLSHGSTSLRESLRSSLTVSQQPTTENDLHRISSHPSAVLGAFYDVRTESIVGQLELDKKIITKSPQSKQIQCEVMKAVEIEQKDIFQKVGIDEEFWLNSVLGFFPSEGMATLVNYSFPKSSNIRFLYYYYSSETKSISDTQHVVQNTISKYVPTISATHIISSIKLGIQALIVLELSNDDEINLNRVLENIAKELSRNQFSISGYDKSSFDGIIVKKVFSNIAAISKMTRLLEICQKVTEIKQHVFDQRPLEFTLRSITWFYPYYSKRKSLYTLLKPEMTNMINIHLQRFSKEIEKFNSSFNVQEIDTLRRYLDAAYDTFQQQITDVQRIHSNELKRVRELVIEIRNGTILQEQSIQELSEEFAKSLQDNFDPMNRSLQYLQRKMNQISKLGMLNITYMHMQRYRIKENDDLKEFFQKQRITNKSESIYCSHDDDAKGQNSAECKARCEKWMEKREDDSELILIFADFTGTQYPLPKERILFIVRTNLCGTESTTISKREFEHKKAYKKSKDSPISSEPISTKHSATAKDEPNHAKPQDIPVLSTVEEPNHAEPPKTATENLNDEKEEKKSSPPPIKYINVLLLGESGVGKSTFINALVNYHKFENFEQACSNKPLVAMPFFFLMTVGDDFEERIVRFGDIDPNEDYDHPGQSVTHCCRSYVFKIGTQTKLRLIDTPGMGDTRGLEQDDLNMENIISFISNLPHLNAICILLKPKESRLNVVLRSYLTRLLNFLGENARNNIVFCFTSIRSIFFAPGDTGPLLRRMINSIPTKGIPFEKKNTFCFDSEAFRYLVAEKNCIQFDKYQEKKYQRSWTSSSTTSIQFIEYVSKQLQPYKRSEWQSLEHAQFMIEQLIRPMLESTRNILRNILLLKEKSSELIIQLRPVAISQLSAICYRCVRTPQRFLDFWILPDNLHTLSNTNNCCSCSRKRHINVSYSIEYELVQCDPQQSFGQMQKNFDQLRKAIIDFAPFYAYVVDSLKQDDALLAALERIIAEEKQILEEKGQKCFNPMLYSIFTSFTEEYKKKRLASISISLPVDLPGLYELIQSINQIDGVKEQMHAITTYQQKYLQQHEKQIS